MGAVAVVTILAIATQQRITLPSAPLADPDSWGYIGPAHHHEVGGGFPQTYGRGFLYPSFVHVIAKLGGSLSSVVLVQHGLGLLGGLAFWAAWIRLRRLLPPTLTIGLLHGTLGLCALGFYLLNNKLVFYEHSLRPEGLFSFVACLALWLTVRCFTLVPAAPASVLAAGLLATAHLVLHRLHPSFTLAAVACLLPPLASMVVARVAWWKPAAVLALMAIGHLALARLETVVYSSRDTTGRIFGAMTLFAFHADLSREALRAELSAPRADAPPRTLIEDSIRLIDEEIARTTREGRSHSTLAYNADRLIYNGASVCSLVRNHYQDHPEAIHDFFLHYFLTGVRLRPDWYLAKIGRNLELAYAPGSAKLFTCISPHIDMARELAYSEQSLIKDYPEFIRSKLGREYARALNIAPRTPPQWSLPPLQLAIARLGPGYLPLVAASLCAALAMAARPAWRRSPDLARLRAHAAVTLAILAYNAVLSLTIAMISSQDNNRYSENQFAFSIFGWFAAALFLVHVIATVWPRQSHQS